MPFNIVEYIVDCLYFYLHPEERIVNVVDAVPVREPIEEPHIKVKLHFDNICWG